MLISIYIGSPHGKRNQLLERLDFSEEVVNKIIAALSAGQGIVLTDKNLVTVSIPAPIVRTCLITIRPAREAKG